MKTEVIFTLIKYSEVNNKHKNKYGELKTILSIWSFKSNIFIDGRLMKHKSRLFAHGGMKKWVINYWETYAPVLNWMIMISLLDISITNEFPSISIDFLLSFQR